jgi:hypothetical protein
LRIADFGLRISSLVFAIRNPKSTMFERFSSTFLGPRGDRWFRRGLVVASARPRTVGAALAKLESTFPGVLFDLLAKPAAVEALPPATAYRYVFPVKRPLGGLRLLLHARQEYDLVVLFAAGERELALCRACALLLLRPRRFFVFNEFSDGFWLHRDDAAQIRGHFERRYNWAGKRWRLKQMRDWVLSVLRPYGRAARWLALLPYRAVLLLGAAVLFLPAVLLLLLLRAAYSARAHRFRFLGRLVPAPRVLTPQALYAEKGGAAHAAAAAAGALPGGHVPAAPAAPGPRRQFTPAAPELKAECLLITGACDGLAWTPGKIQLSDGSRVSFWVVGLPPAADVADVRARVDSLELEVEFVAPPRSGPRQVNARLPAGIQPGQYQLAVSLGDTQSPPFPLTIE